MLAWLAVRLTHLVPFRPPGIGGTPPLLLEVRLDAVAAQGLSLSTVHGDLLWVDGGWPGSCHEQELLALSGLGEVLDAAEVATILDRGFRGIAKPREHLHAPVGDRRIRDRLTGEQRAFNRVQAGLRALVEQSIAHLAGAWALRRWRGLLYPSGTSSGPPAR